MTPLVLLVLAVTAGTVLGDAADGGATAGACLAVTAGGLLIVAGCAALRGRSRAAWWLGLPSALLWGVGLGTMATASAWAPPGIDLATEEAQVARGAPLRLRGVLQRDAWRTPDGGVSFDLRIDEVSTATGWRRTRIGGRVTVGGTGGPARLSAWTRGTRVTTPVAAFRRPLPYRNFGVANAERALARQGLRVFASVKSASLVDAEPGPWWERWAASVRGRVRATIGRHVGDPTAAAIVTAILIGDRSALPADVEQRLQLAGVYHVVAISGGNVAAFLAIVLLVPRVAGWRGPATVVVLVAALAAFALVVDGGASVARAVLVAAAVVAAKWWDVRVRAAQALAVAGALQVLADPLTPGDPGAVLSFGAAGALVFVGRLSVARASRLAASARQPPWRAAVRAGTGLVAATLAVEAVLLPVAMRWFGLATAAGVFANLLAVPAMLLVQATGTAVVLLAPVSTVLADGGGLTAARAVSGLLASGEVARWAPWLVRHVPPPGGAIIATYYLALVMAGALLLVLRASAGPRRVRAAAASLETPLRARRRRWSSIALALASATVCTALAVMVVDTRERSAPAPWTWVAATGRVHASWPAEPWLLVTVIDVGQGDATVIRFPTGRTWLVDAGGTVGEGFDVGTRVTARAVWALGHRRLSRVLVTHAHPDHAAGMPAVIARLRPREVLIGVDVPGDPLQARLITTAAEAGATVRRVATGETFAEGPVHVRVLHPERPDWERRRVRNDDSIVLWIRFGDVGLLLPGDVGRAEEGQWAHRIAAAPLGILRLAHHGSATSTSQVLLDALAPRLAIGSMARGNRFGHPAAAVLRRLAEVDTPVLRTDEVGAIQLATNGRTVLVRTASGLSWGLTAPTTPRAWSPATPLPSDRGSPGPASSPRKPGGLPHP